MFIVVLVLGTVSLLPLCCVIFRADPDAEETSTGNEERSSASAVVLVLFPELSNDDTLSRDDSPSTDPCSLAPSPTPTPTSLSNFPSAKSIKNDGLSHTWTSHPFPFSLSPALSLDKDADKASTACFASA